MPTHFLDAKSDRVEELQEMRRLPSSSVFAQSTTGPLDDRIA